MPLHALLLALLLAPFLALEGASIAPPCAADALARNGAKDVVRIACEPSAAAPEVVERSLAAMGTSWTLVVEAPTRAQALAASEAAVRALADVEARLSTWRADSELARVNRAPVDQALPLSPELGALLARAWSWRAATSGAFDPRVGPLVRAWDLRGEGRAPAAPALAAALEAMGPGAWDASELPARLTRRRADAALEEGGFGKGAGLDAALAALRDAGVTSARLDLGGQVAVLTGGEAQRYAIAAPDERARGVLALDLTRGSIATSGNSERGLVVDGRRVGHLLDPRTGRPAADFGSVSVWCPNALDADCLSTALYVLGPERALAFAHAADGVEAVVLERDGDALRARATDGLRGRLHALDPAMRVEWFAPAADSPSASTPPVPRSEPR